MPQEWTVTAVWVVVYALNNVYIKVFKRKHLAEEWVAQQPIPERYKVIREDITY